jgi:hypothetical protein
MKRRNSSSTRAQGGTAASPSPGTYRGRVAPSDSALGANAIGDIDLIVSHNAVAAVAADENTQRKVGTLFQGAFAAMKEIVWDYHDKAVVFTMADGRVSSTFIIPTLRQVGSTYCSTNALVIPLLTWIYRISAGGSHLRSACGCGLDSSTKASLHRSACRQ